jgi:thiol-disulfide isomerase/thioredoxin
VRKLLAAFGVLALTAVVVAGLLQASDEGGASTPQPRFDLPAGLRQLEGAPAPLAALHEDAAKLVRATPASFGEQLEALEGHPVVVNKWASWCGPCRAEFPIFQRQSVKHGREIAFVGLNARDGRKPASRFLRSFPVPYPSFEDPQEKIARDIGAPANYPITLFYDARGKLAFSKQGGYRSEADLEADIERYAR